MSVIRWNAFREFDDLLARAPQRAGGACAPASVTGAFTPLADISETAAGYLIELELPGLAAKDVKVSVQDGVLTVAGERVAGHLHAVTEDDLPADTLAGDIAQAPRLHRTERQYGTFERRFRLPKDANAGGVTASAKDGVLRLTIGRRAEAARRSIAVQVA